MNCETRNLLRRCGDPFVCGRIIGFFICRIIFSFQYRYKRSITQYPASVRAVLQDVLKYKFTSAEAAFIRRQKDRGNDAFTGSGRIKLASGYLSYNKTPDWKQQFDDPEQMMSLHRWRWLLNDMEQTEGIGLMRSWLQEMGPVPEGIAGTSYTTGERIVSAILFFGQERIPEDLRAALLTMAWHLAQHIEYHGVRGTGNHVVNNARALFFAGQTFNIRPFSTLALAILEDALPWLVTKDGFLREESSHYHLLFTRWLIEIYELAKRTNHQGVEEYLEPWIKKLAEKCWFFLVQDGVGAWQIPLIGDVSPDCTPPWLISYLKPLIEQYKPNLWPVQGVKDYKQSGWFRLDWKLFTIFWHLPQTNMIHRPHHGHSDACSFVLFYQGKPTFIDPGRPTYCANDLLSQSSVSAQGHNSLAVDGLSPFVYDKEQKFPAFYQQREVKINYKEENQLFIFSITHTGFQRLRRDRVDHTRSFKIGDDFMEIEDKVSGCGQHFLETFFHWAPGIEAITRRDNQYEAGPMIFTLNAQGAKVINHSDWSFPEYGEKVESHSISIKQLAQLPLVNLYRFQW